MNDEIEYIQSSNQIYMQSMRRIEHKEEQHQTHKHSDENELLDFEKQWKINWFSEIMDR